MTSFRPVAVLDHPASPRGPSPAPPPEAPTDETAPAGVASAPRWEAWARGLLRGLLALPAPLFGSPPLSDRGVALDPHLHRLMRLLAWSRSPPLNRLGPARARVTYACATRVMDVPPLPLYRVEEQELSPGGPRARVYVPRSGGGLGACVFFHGGGFVIGDPDAYEGVCRYLARRAGCVVVSVDYRLAPEHPFPAAVEDALVAWRAVCARASEWGVEAGRVAVAGDSAGANLAAVLCQQLRAAGELQPLLQLLVYPVTSARGDEASRRTFAEGYYLTEPLISWFRRCYLGDTPTEDARAAPLLATELSGLAPAVVVTAGFDPLRDEGEAYAARLEAAGVPVRHRRHEELLHGFLSMSSVSPAAARAVEQLTDDLAAALAPHGRARAATRRSA